MPEPYAEVIGDPIAHSLSPVIHRHWLRQLGLPGDYRATRCTPAKLPEYLASRRADPAWRGCNLTMPLKEQAAGLVDELDQAAQASGAVNCIVRVEGKLIGRNTDVNGVAAVMGDLHLEGCKAVVIGGGGVARAALIALRRRGAALHLLVRAPQRATALEALAPGLAVGPFESAAKVTADAALLINATPLGMAGNPGMPQAILDSLATAPDALAFDMVYRPIETPFLQAAAEAGLQTVDGFAMLIAQARPAFRSFFGAEPPPGDADLRAALIAQLRAG